MKTIFEQQGVEYRQVGDYMLPNVGLNELKEYQIGLWGQRYSRHLKEKHRIIYYNYLTKGTLNKHLAEVDIRAEEMFQQFVKSLAEKENVTENATIPWSNDTIPPRQGTMRWSKPSQQRKPRANGWQTSSRS